MRIAMRVEAAGVALLGGVALLAGCSSTGTEAVSATASATASSPVTTSAPAPVASATRTAGAGCRANAATIPRGAAVRATEDLDRDGTRDELWLADSGSTRTLGVRTGTGAVFSTRFTSAAPQSATATGARLAGADASVVLLDTGRSVALYAVVDCALVPARNAQGQQYTFDLGFTGFGTGVACPDLGTGRVLAGLLAQPTGTTYRVTRTTVDLTDSGRSARNGATTTLATNAPAGDPRVRSAMTVTCGAGNPAVAEPAG